MNLTVHKAQESNRSNGYQESKLTMSPTARERDRKLKTNLACHTVVKQLKSRLGNSHELFSFKFIGEEVFEIALYSHLSQIFLECVSDFGKDYEPLYCARLTLWVFSPTCFVFVIRFCFWLIDCTVHTCMINMSRV